MEMLFGILFWFMAAVPFLCLALIWHVPECKKSFRRLFAVLLLAFVGIFLPLLTFFLSSLMDLDSKAACRHGWLDCFILGKLALTPGVLWAVVAWTKVEIYRVKDRTKPWIVLGYFTGALISTVCTIVGWIIFNDGGICMWLLVPTYVMVWYGLRTVQLMKEAQLSLWCYFSTVAATVPFWIGAILWSRKIYELLPDESNSCFVVTAAMRGDPGVVGPFTTVIRHGQARKVNRQLVVFWEFEERWRNSSPQSHLCFRRIYNQLGPQAARMIRRRWQADLVYLTLKPMEWGIKMFTKRTSQGEPL